MYGRMALATLTELNRGYAKPINKLRRTGKKNIIAAEQCVIRNAAGDKLRQGSFDAAVSITFNVGCPAMQKSTMFQLFRQGRPEAACEQFPRWVYASGVKLNGLVIRRDKERALCLAK